jgi:PAS domain S-box-containing protein
MAELPHDLSWLPVFALDRISDFVIITDADLDDPEGPHIIYVNRTVIETTGYEEHELIGRSPRIFQGPRPDRSTKVRVRTSLRDGMPLRETVLNYTKTGRRYWTELNIAPLRNAEGKVIYFLSIQRDVTEQRKALEALERDRRLVVAGEKIGKIGTWGYDLVEKKMLWSEGTYDIFEWDKSESPPNIEGILDFVTPDDREIMADLLDRCIRLQEPYQWETGAVTAKGTPVLLVVRGEALKGQDGRTKAVVGAIRDITDEKRTVETLDQTLSRTRMLERHFASARAAAKIGIFDYSVSQDLQYWSVELLDMTGLTDRPFPAPAEAFISGIDAADRPQFDALFARAVEDGEDYTITVRFHRPDGRVMHMQIIAEVRDIDGDRRIVGIARDVTKEVEASNLLLREKVRFEIIADTVSDVLWDWEIDKDTWWVSPNWPQKLGLALDGGEFSPHRWTDYVSEGDRNRARESLRAALKSGRSRWRGEFRVEDLDGSTVDVEINATILRRPDGWAYRMLGNLRNITIENRQREGTTRSRALEAVGKMTGGIAHDFNNLLMIIQGNAELLGLSDLDEEDRECVQLINKATHAAADLTARLLSFSGQVRLKSTNVNLRDLLAELVPLLRSGLTSAVDLKLSFADDIWDVEVDAAALEQAIINLAVNARDAMPNGGTLTLACENRVISEEMIGAADGLRLGCYVRISISDTGVGMTEDVLAKACEPFFTTKDVGKGTGLGLSTVFGFARQSGGGLHIDSQVGKGTNISLYLPASKSALATSLPSGERATPHLQASSIRVLVVEDQPDVRAHVEKLLRRAGYLVAAAQDAKTALDILKLDKSFDILFTDVVMPGGINGVQLAAEALKIVPEIKVLYTSGFPSSAFDEIGVDRGEELVMLSKPYKSAELLHAMNQLAASQARLLPQGRA